jgi:hypothetical protein
MAAPNWHSFLPGNASNSTRECEWFRLCQDWRVAPLCLCPFRRLFGIVQRHHADGGAAARAPVRIRGAWHSAAIRPGDVPVTVDNFKCVASRRNRADGEDAMRHAGWCGRNVLGNKKGRHLNLSQVWSGLTLPQRRYYRIIHPGFNRYYLKYTTLEVIRQTDLIFNSAALASQRRRAPAILRQ